MPDGIDSGLFSALDRHFARFIGRFAGADPHPVLLAAALVSHATGNGDVCLDLNACAEKSVTGSPTAPACPPVDLWVAALRGCPAVGRPGERRPLVLDDANRLYLHRYWEYESRLAARILERAGAPPGEMDTGRLKAAIQRRFIGCSGPGTDWQQVAVAVSMLKRFAVITGGPGTGKTTTVAGILAVWEEVNQGRATRVLLAAPTGKAAARLKESLGAGAGLPAPAIGSGPATACEVYTLHRLLRPVVGTPLFRHSAENPLPVDLMIVDEVSMVDLALMAKLVDALPGAARLVLIGDRDQLASVEAGSVLGDICGRSRRPGFSPEFGEVLRRVTGQTVPPATGGRPLQDCIVELQTSHRFAAGSAIGEISRAVNQGDGRRTVEILSQTGKGTVAWLEPPAGADGMAGLEERLAEGYAAYPTEDGPEAMLQALGRFKVLCAHRTGVNGVEAVNRMAERMLVRQGRVRINPRSGSPWYPGRPVLITQNDYGLGLFNGDIGITLRDPTEGSEGLAVFFPDPAGGLRRFLPYRLPAHETVYAMTVHKSQGSEFEEVLLVLPVQDSPVLSRELVYTALTRARKRITLVAGRDVLTTAVHRRIERTSGLRDALWGETQSNDGSGG
jgi:exodeoxyribonuclease V alpha subunit